MLTMRLAWLIKAVKNTGELCMRPQWIPNKTCARSTDPEHCVCFCIREKKMECWMCHTFLLIQLSLSCLLHQSVSPGTPPKKNNYKLLFHSNTFFTFLLWQRQTAKWCSISSLPRQRSLVMWVGTRDQHAGEGNDLKSLKCKTEVKKLPQCWQCCFVLFFNFASSVKSPNMVLV